MISCTTRCRGIYFITFFFTFIAVQISIHQCADAINLQLSHKRSGSKKQFKSSSESKYGGGPFKSKKDGKVGKDKRFEVNNDNKKVNINVQTEPIKPEQFPKRAPPPSNAVEKIPTKSDEISGCCTICVTKIYEGIALLQLPYDVEQATLHNFHKEYSKHLTTRKRNAKNYHSSIPTTPTFLQTLEIQQNQLNKGGKKSKGGKKKGARKKGSTKTSKTSKGGKSNKSTSSNPGKLAPQLPSTGLDKGDVLQNLESKASEVAGRTAVKLQPKSS